MRTRGARCRLLVWALLLAGALFALFAAGVAAARPFPAELPGPSLPSPPADERRAAAFLPLRATTACTLPDPSWRIGVTTDGLYRLPYGALAGAGVPVTGTEPSAYHLLWRGQEVALQEVGTGDGTFDPGDALLFYGEGFSGTVQDEKYTDENVYWLAVYTTTAGLRVTGRSVAPTGGDPLDRYTATVRAEEDLIYWARHSDAPGTDEDWFWEQVTTDLELDPVPHIVPVTWTYGITLSDPFPVSYDALLRVELAGKSANYHHLRFLLNGTQVGETDWTGNVGHVASVVFPATSIQAGQNALSVVVLADGGAQVVYLNWFEVEYRRRPVARGDVLALATPLSGTAAMTLTGFSTSSLHLHDVSDPLAPVRLVDAAPFLSGTTYALAAADAAPEGTAYLATAESAVVDVLSPTLYHPPSGLLAPAEGADEIIVAPAAYVAALEPLADLRRSQGLRVRVVDVADVYALFNGGVYHPEAIRGFVAHAHAHWPGPPPAYLLLVSDGNFNFKGHNPAVYGDFVPSPIPPFLEFADPDQGEVPVDSRYGDVDGDGMPEVMVGRIPAGSLAQVEGVVQKIVAYEAAPPLSPWTERVLMAADDGPEPFTGALNSLANLVPGHVEVRRIYLEEYGDALSATRDLTRTWGQGALLLTYAGHAAVWRWGGSPRLIVNTQLAGLTGTTGLPFLLSLDCWDGYWMFPPEYPGFTGRDVRSIGEWATTVLTDRGAIAAFGPAGLAYLGGEEQVAQAVYGAVFEDGVRELGLLARAGREAISGTYLARTYTLLGDPALRLASVPRRVYVPTVLRSY